jgi:hypothetical protein
MKNVSVQMALCNSPSGNRCFHEGGEYLSGTYASRNSSNDFLFAVLMLSILISFASSDTVICHCRLDKRTRRGVRYES